MTGYHVWREIAPAVWSLATVRVFNVKEQAEAYAMGIRTRTRIWPVGFSPPGTPAPSVQAIRQVANR